MNPINKYSVNTGKLADQTLWPQLLESIEPKTPFDLPIWNTIWFKHFGNNDSQVILSVLGRDINDSLVMPLVRNGDTLKFFGSTDCVDYHNVIGKNITADLLTPAVQWITQDIAIKRLVLESLPESPVIHYLKNTFENHGWRSELHLEDVAPRVSLPVSWEVYLASLSSKNRHEIRRKVRRLESSGSIKHADLVTPAEIKNGMDTFIALHKKSSVEKEAYMTAKKEAFFREVAVALAEKNLVKIAYLDIDEKRVACALTFIVDNIAYVYNSGFDLMYAHLSVGFLNHVFSLSRSMDQGIKIVDFMRGNERYKYNLGCFDRQLYRLTLDRK